MTEKTRIELYIEGENVTKNIEDSLLSLSYVDNDTDKADDLQLSIDDKDDKWLKCWLNPNGVKDEKDVTEKVKNATLSIGDMVIVSGTPQYTSYGGKPSATVTNYEGEITYLNQKEGVGYPVHVGALGWFKESDVSKKNRESISKKEDIKGLEISAVIIQDNYHEDGKSKVLDCGIFAVDTISVSGPPTTIKFKALSIPKNATINGQTKTKAWEQISLASIASEIASGAGIDCLYDTLINPVYKRKEQIQETDLQFLTKLCRDAAVNIKVTAKTLVLYDASIYESKTVVTELTKGKNDIMTYSFGTNKNQTAYTGAVVKSKDPVSGKYIEYTYNLLNVAAEKKILEIKETVASEGEAELLAKRRLRSKNKGEHNASFLLVGNVDLVAGQTIKVIGFGLFDGKYIINTATHNLTSGYTTSLKMNKVLEGY